MKNFRTFRKTAFIAAFTLLGATFAFQSCDKDDDEPVVDTKVSVQTIEFSVIDSETKDAVSGVEATLTFDDASTEVLTIENGILTIDVKERPDGDCQAVFAKEGYIAATCDLVIDRSTLGEKDDWASVSTIMMSEANETFAVEVGVEKTVEVEESEVSVVFPADCLTESAEISVTELPSAEEQIEANVPVEIVADRIPLQTIDFQPDGQEFEEPIAVTFTIPAVADDLLFGTIVDGTWESVPVIKNGDGTGTAMISHFSQWSVTTTETWTETEEVIELGPFDGSCGNEFTAQVSVPGEVTLSLENTYEAIADSYKSIYVSYTKVTKTSSKGTEIDYATGPYNWRYEFTVCNPQDHTGGAGN